MAKDKYTVTVGPRAYSFHDQSTGITVCRGAQRQQQRLKEDIKGINVGRNEQAVKHSQKKQCHQMH